MFNWWSGRISRRHFLAAWTTVAGVLARRTTHAQTVVSGHAQDVEGMHSLRQHATDAKLLFGFAVDPTMLRINAMYRQAVVEQCSLIVAENALKWNALAPTPRTYSFSEADDLLAFCEGTGIKLRGTPLCWHSALPDWFAATATPANARVLLENYIHTVAGRYAGRMHSWDVVNEAIELGDGRPDGLRNSPWLKLLGPEYIEIAFRAARESDPTALLSYNDYDLEPERSGGAKRAAVLMLLRRLKQRKVPIDAVGLQSHVRTGDVVGPGLMAFIESCREMGLQVFLSELDVNDRFSLGGVESRDRAVAETYRQYLDATLGATNVTAVLTWGVSDGNSWLGWVGETRIDGRALRPLLLDANFQSKPAFFAVRDALDHRGQSASRATPNGRQGHIDRP